MRMRSAAVVCVLAGLAVLAGSRPALAHHSFAAEFDFKRPLQLQGTIVKME